MCSSVTPVFAAFIAIIAATTPFSAGAPSTFHNQEFSLPLENQASVALVDAKSGQFTVLDFSGGPTGVMRGPFHSLLPSVTGVSGGLFDEKETEYLALSSTQENAVRLFGIGGAQPIEIEVPLTNPGPAGTIPLHQKGLEPEVLIHTTLASKGNSLDLFKDVLKSANQTAEVSGLENSSALQSHRNFDGNRQGLLKVGNEIHLLQPDSGEIKQTMVTSAPEVAQIATEIVGNDNRHCALVFSPGSADLEIITLPEGGFGLQAIATQFDDNIAAITPIPEAAGAWILSQDGQTAYEVQINEGAELEILSKLDAPKTLRLNHLLYLDSLGLIALQGSLEGGRSDRFRRYSRDGDSWTEENGSFLPDLLPTSEDFATLFWFDGSPLSDPTSQLVKLETLPEWTRKTSNLALPATIETSSLASTTTGLAVTGTTATAPPAEASFLLTNQIDDSLSISALNSTEALRRPILSVNPPSGSYPTSVQLEADFDSAAVEVFMRRTELGGSWEPFSPLTISYPSSYYFYAKDLTTGLNGPVITRSFSFPDLNLNELDSDRDGVPDYVELANGLDPAGGADSDGDFQSDLEELLAGTDPARSTSRTLDPELREPPFIGEGFAMAAQAYHEGLVPGEAAEAIGDPLSGGTSLSLYDFTGDLLGSSLVEKFTAQRQEELSLPVSFSGINGAYFKINRPVPESDWVVLSTPTFWRYASASDDRQDGQEMVKVMARPINQIPAIAHEPTGTDLVNDAQDWVTAARLAYEDHDSFSELTRITESDLVVSVIAETALHQKLTEIFPETPSRPGFTLFPFREADLARQAFTEEMKAALRAEGFDFPAVIAAIEEEVLDSGQLPNLATELTDRYRSARSLNPLMPAPLDALRDLIATGTISDDRGGDRTHPYQEIIDNFGVASQGEMESILALLDGLLRPRATYTIAVENLVSPAGQIRYRITAAEDPARIGELLWATDAFGEQFSFDQGLGLSTGSTFTVEGFIDITPPLGFVGLEVTAITGATIFVASEQDTDADLLNDQWEELFFGSTDAINGLDKHPVTGHSYLEYQVTGEDPRAGTLENAPLTLVPSAMKFGPTIDGSAYLLSFNFPSEYLHFFDFSLEMSETMIGFSTTTDMNQMEEISPNRYAFETDPIDPQKKSSFWRIKMSATAP